MSNLTTSAGVVAYMKAATSADDWNTRCNEVKKANGGDYPSFWFAKIITSGLLADTKASW